MSKSMKIGIIGGTGLDNNPDLIEGRKVSIIGTNYGSIEVIEGKICGVECVRKSLKIILTLKHVLINNLCN